MIDDRIDGDCGLTGLAVADDQFSLTASDWDHGVDGLDAGLQRLMNRLTLNNARSLDFNLAEACRY